MPAEPKREGDASVCALLAICRPEFHPDSVVWPSCIEEWSALRKCACENGVIGLLSSRLTIGQVPSEIRSSIEADTRAQIAKNCHLAVALLDILSAFRQNGIRALALKGPVLACDAYGSLATRDFGDLDVFVREADVPCAGDILLRSGYAIESSEEALNAPNSPGSYHRAYTRNGLGITVELHWRLMPDAEYAPLERTGVWSRIRSTVVFGQRVFTLGAEDTILFLAIHGFKHGWARLKWVLDIAYLLNRSDDINWTALLSRASSIGCRRALLVCLALAGDLCNCSVPALIHELAAHDHRARDLVDALRSRLLCDNVDEFDHSLRFVLLRDGWRNRLVHSARLFARIFRLTRHDGITENYTMSELLVAACKRPIRLYRTYGLGWAKHLLSCL